MNYDLTQKQLYKKLFRLYENNGYFKREYNKDIKPLITPVNRSVEFFASKLSLPYQITAQDETLKDAIDLVHKWSNFSAKKTVGLRQLALYGNLFWKVICDNEKVYFEIIDPNFVSDITVNERGYLQTIRIDIPIEDENKRKKTYTEYWTKEYFSIWEHELGENAELENLGDPVSMGWLREMGIDFIPIVHVKFKDIGNKWGVGSVYHCLDKIEEANKQASRLSDLLFRYNKNTTVISANDKDSNGRPIPAPLMEDNNDPFKTEDDTILYLSGLAKIESLIPNINYDSALNIKNSALDELNNDLPELRYYSIKEGSLSGKAIRSLLGGAIDRANEALNNFLAGLVRVNQIALTLGKFWGIFPLNGSYENGNFEHSITTPELFPIDDGEKAILIRDLISGGLALSTALKVAGYDEDFIELAMEEKSIEDSKKQENLGDALMRFNSGV